MLDAPQRQHVQAVSETDGPRADASESAQSDLELAADGERIELTRNNESLPAQRATFFSQSMLTSTYSPSVPDSSQPPMGGPCDITSAWRALSPLPTTVVPDKSQQVTPSLAGRSLGRTSSRGHLCDYSVSAADPVHEPNSFGAGFTDNTTFNWAETGHSLCSLTSPMNAFRDEDFAAMLEHSNWYERSFTVLPEGSSVTGSQRCSLVAPEVSGTQQDPSLPQSESPW